MRAQRFLLLSSFRLIKSESRRQTKCEKFCLAPFFSNCKMGRWSVSGIINYYLLIHDLEKLFQIVIYRENDHVFQGLKVLNDIFLLHYRWSMY